MAAKQNQKNQIVLRGVGIHSGLPVKIVIKPSKKYGIFFRRTDIPGAPAIPATWDNAPSAQNMNTTIGRAPNQVQTIEHLMAAFFVLGFNAVIVEIDGPETPIMDGSAAEFIKVLSPVKWGKMPVKKIIVKKEIIAYRRDLIKRLPLLTRMAIWFHNLTTGRKEDGFVKLSPGGKTLDISMTIDFPDKVIGRETYDYSFDGGEKSVKEFISQISRARTFGRIWEWEYLKKRGKGKGANEKNVIVLNQDSTGTLNKLHYRDEFVRHKIVDLVGDLATSGGMIVGRVKSVKGSHGLNNEVLRKLFSDPDNYDIIQKK